MFIGIDDTDSPQGMCTTYLGAVLIRRLIRVHMKVHEARLVRLNPNVTWKTRGNAAVSLRVEGDEKTAFDIACATVEELADFSCENTNPGVVVTACQPDPAFYRKAVTDFCQVDEAIGVLKGAGAHYKGYKNRRGLIGATAAVSSELTDTTSEILVYRQPEQWGTARDVDRLSLFTAEEATFPHTWDTVDKANDVVVCVPHTPDPVLFGIRGESPSWVIIGRQLIQSEKTGIEQIWVTNQGTDAHILAGRISDLKEGLSYRISGVVKEAPSTLTGGHVSLTIEDNNHSVRCMAYEPTKNFRPIVRQLMQGDEITVYGSYKKGSINLEKIRIVKLAEPIVSRPPLCTTCNKRMTSDGTGKGYKCKKCGIHARDPELRKISRSLKPGWYEVPPTARRHLAKPLCRGEPEY